MTDEQLSSVNLQGVAKHQKTLRQNIRRGLRFDVSILCVCVCVGDGLLRGIGEAGREGRRAGGMGETHGSRQVPTPPQLPVPWEYLLPMVVNG